MSKDYAGQNQSEIIMNDQFQFDSQEKRFSEAIVNPKAIFVYGDKNI